MRTTESKAIREKKDRFGCEISPARSGRVWREWESSGDNERRRSTSGGKQQSLLLVPKLQQDKRHGVKAKEEGTQGGSANRDESDEGLTNGDVLRQGIRWPKNRLAPLVLHLIRSKGW